MSAAAQAIPQAAPRSFNAAKYFSKHRPPGVSKYSRLPVEVWTIQRSGPWKCYMLSSTQEKYLRALNRLVPEEDLNSDRPWITGPAGYGRLAKITHTTTSTARRILAELADEFHCIARWDVTSNAPRPKRKAGQEGRRETRYLIRRYADVRTRLETDPAIGKVPDPSNDNTPHFYRFGARLLTPDEVVAWDGPGCMAAKCAWKEAKAARQGIHAVPTQAATETADQSSEPPPAAGPSGIDPDIAGLFRQVDEHLNNADISGMYADVEKLAGPVDRDELIGILRAVIKAGGHIRGFKYLAKCVRDKAKGVGEARALGWQKPEMRTPYS